MPAHGMERGLIFEKAILLLIPEDVDTISGAPQMIPALDRLVPASNNETINLPKGSSCEHCLLLNPYSQSVRAIFGLVIC